MKRLLSLLILPALVLGACGDDDETTAVADAPDRPVEGLVVRVDRVGGFLPVGAGFADVPDVSVYGDGRVLTQGAMIEIYPGPVLVPLQQTSLDGEAIDELFATADELGMLGESLDYGQPPVADAPDTVVTLVTSEGTFEQRANALAEAVDADPSALSDAQQANRERLLEMVRAIDDAAASSMAADAGQYEPTAYRAMAMEEDPPPADPGSGEPEPRLVEWPVDLLKPASIGECTSFESDAAQQLEDLFAEADQLTWFTSEGRTWRVAVRPLLPDESGC